MGRKVTLKICPNGKTLSEEWVGSLSFHVFSIELRQTFVYNDASWQEFGWVWWMRLGSCWQRSPCLAKSRGLAVLRPDYHTVSLSFFFSPLFLANSQFFTFLLALLGTSQYQPSLPGPDHSTPRWRSLGILFCDFYHTTGVHSGQAHSVEDPPGPRTVDVTCSLSYTLPPARDHFVTQSYSTISVSLWTRTNSKQHMLFIPTLEKKSCFLWKPMPGRVLLFPRGFGNEWFFFFFFFWSNKQEKRSKMEVAS